MRPRDWGFLALAAVLAVVFVRLGFWQLSRLQERRANNDLIRARMALPAEPIQHAFDDPSAWTYRTVSLRGEFDPDHEILLSPRSFEDQPGVDLITPLKLEGETATVLVDRGWIPFETIEDGPRAAYRLAGPVELQGLVMPSQPSVSFFFISPPTPSPDAFRAMWQSVDIPGLQVQMPYPLLPFYVAQTGPQPGSDLPPIPDPDVDVSDGPHLSYALQWFAFALIAVIGAGVWIRRRSPGAT